MGLVCSFGQIVATDEAGCLASSSAGRESKEE
jgi:hypothetical protein